MTKFINDTLLHWGIVTCYLLATLNTLFWQSKGDLQCAEEYYSRAILADPKDGEILSQYAKLIWELHHDQDRALSYFERAVQASPEDRYVYSIEYKFYIL